MCCVMPPASERPRRSADGVEQRRLAVVDVPHDRHDGRPGHHGVGRVLDGDLLGLVLDAQDRDLALHLGADQLDGLVGERLGDGHELAQAHHRLDDLGVRDPSFSA
jgi:hypothetical protein